MTLANMEKGDREWKETASDVRGPVKGLLLFKLWQFKSSSIFIRGVVKLAVAWGSMEQSLRCNYGLILDIKPCS